MNKVITCLVPLHGRGKECGDVIRGQDAEDIVATL